MSIPSVRVAEVIPGLSNVYRAYLRIDGKVYMTEIEQFEPNGRLHVIDLNVCLGS